MHLPQINSGRDYNVRRPFRTYEVWSITDEVNWFYGRLRYDKAQVNTMMLVTMVTFLSRYMS